MPAQVPVPISRLSKEEFEETDFAVMKHAFASQNELGRLCEESIYKTDVAARLADCGMTAASEVRVLVSHRDFLKEYRLDLLVAEGAVYELKSVTTLTREHDAQLLNYLFLVDAQHGKLVNFRSPSAETRLVHMVVSPEEQRRFTLARDRWQELENASRGLPDTLWQLGKDWGVYLETRLYLDALIHFLGGEPCVMHPVPLARAGIPLGSQKMALLSDDVALRLTAVSEPRALEAHLRRLLALTPLAAIQWVNFNRHTIELVTLHR